MAAFLALVPALAAALSLGCTNRASAGTRSEERAADLRPREVRVESVESAEIVQLEGGGRLRLSGLAELQRSDPAVLGRLAKDMVGKTLLLRPDPPRPLDAEEPRGELWDGPSSVNERVLARGDARLDLTHGSSAGDERFHAVASATAGPTRRGAIPLGFQAGIVLPMYSKEARHDYGPRLREIQATGARWVSLLFVWMLDKMDGHSIEPKRNQPHWEDNRTPPDEDLVAAIRTAKDLGLQVLLLPVVLPWKPGPDDWRGNLRPANRDAFFESYGRFILRHADLAESLGVDALSIGSELISLESRQPSDIPAWRRIARTVRARFTGRLTYSANWDHYEEVGVWDELDFVGMTAYYSLTRDFDATIDELVAAWKPVQRDLAAFAAKVERPIVFTEVGYASLRGINTDPWNYKMETGLDLAVQERCYRAFAKAFEGCDWLAGAYFFDWFDDGGTKDTGYTPRGKPAEGAMREFLATAGKRPPPLYDPAKRPQ
jgi:glycosyl hydrolase family 113